MSTVAENLQLRNRSWIGSNRPALFDPKEAVLYAQYYLVRAEEAEPEQARRLFEQAAELISDTEQPILLTALTSYLVEAEQLGLAGRICAAALNLPTLRHRQRLSLLLLQAKIALGSGDGWLAQNSLKKVLNLDPQNIEAQVLQLSLAAGEAAQAQEFTRAIGLYQQMIELAPQQTELHFQLGRLYLEAGQPEMAAQMFEICRQRGHRTAEIESLQAVESQS
jgi:tetratricopeptide (TPR) repeat protein